MKSEKWERENAQNEILIFYENVEFSRTRRRRLNWLHIIGKI